MVLLVAMFLANVQAAREGLMIAGRRAMPLPWRLPLQLFWIAALWWADRIHRHVRFVGGRDTFMPRRETLRTKPNADDGLMTSASRVEQRFYRTSRARQPSVYGRLIPDRRRHDWTADADMVD